MPPTTPLPSPSSLLPALRSHRWFGSCPLEFQQALIDRAVPWQLADGEHLFARGGVGEGLCCVVSGALRIGAVRSDGSQTLLAYLLPYQWFGEISVIDGLPRTHDAIADGETIVLAIPQASLAAWLDMHPQYWRDLSRLACTKLRLAFTVLEDIQHLPLQVRLARHLWATLHALGEAQNSARRTVKLSQEQLGQLLGTSRQSVNKCLRELEELGIVSVGYSQIDVLDPAGLQRLALESDDGSVPPGLVVPPLPPKGE